MPNNKFHKVELTAEFMNDIHSYLPYETDDMDTVNEFNNILDNAKPLDVSEYVCLHISYLQISLFTDITIYRYHYFVKVFFCIV